MSIIVQKYGGSSVSDVARIQAVAARVVQTVQAGHQVVVAVSAMGNTTSELLALARAVSHQPGRRELDLLISVGERVSMTLLAMAIQDLGVDAASFTGSQSGIITDERHVAARVIEVRPYRIRQALDDGKVAIVAGFQGVSRAREVTTLGRGGTDTTAVVLAAALGAEHCEICSDVDGVYSADPRVVPSAHKLTELPLDGAIALASHGSKVLLADALDYARRHNVKLHAGATAQPPGTGTALPPGQAPDAVTAIAADALLLHYRVPSLEAVAALSGAARAWWTDGGALEVLLDRRNLHDDGAVPPSWELIGPAATVTAVGRQVVTDPAVVCQAVAAVPCVRWWASGACWTALVPPARLDEAQRSLHEALIPHSSSSSSTSSA